MLKLPRAIETDPLRLQVEGVLGREEKALWPEGTVLVPHVPFTPPLEKALVHALLSKHLERGLEQIEGTLERERKGLTAAREKHGGDVANRASRLLVIADDGSERFFRQCESILRRHGDRVLGLRVDVSSKRLGEKSFGADKLVKAVLVTDRDSTTRVLQSLAAPA